VANRITVTEREPDPGQKWKCGDEFLPFHPQASHVPPDYRDGWNRCYWMAVRCPCGGSRKELWGRPCRFCTDAASLPVTHEAQKETPHG
jgi:hypothetical protein